MARIGPQRHRKKKFINFKIMSTPPLLVSLNQLPFIKSNFPIQNQARNLQQKTQNRAERLQMSQCWRHDFIL